MIESHRSEGSGCEVGDSLVFSVQEIAALADVEEPTKRKVTSIVGKFHDPLGFLSPVVIKFKMFLKDLCEEGLEWDQKLTGDLAVTGCKSEGGTDFLRFYLRNAAMESASYSLHGFSDASMGAYASSFVASKTWATT